jgi:hypothetical protein
MNTIFEYGGITIVILGLAVFSWCLCQAAADPDKDEDIQSEWLHMERARIQQDLRERLRRRA